MEEFCTYESCDDCPSRIVCQCLQVTESQIIEAICSKELRSIHELRRHTAAGEGCTACHARLESYIERFAYSLPICSVR